jgi:DNA adenine methylase
VTREEARISPKTSILGSDSRAPRPRGGPPSNPPKPVRRLSLTANALSPSLDSPRIAAEPSLTPFLKWPGGKSQELPAIAAAAPPLEGRLVDPFVGGGSVLLATPSVVRALVNDACRDLVGLYTAAASQDPAFRQAVTALAAAWDRLAERDSLFADLADIYLRGTSNGAEFWLEHHRADLGSLLGSCGPSLLDLFLVQAVRDLPTKFIRMREVERKVGRRLSHRDLLANVEGAIRSALYMSVRARYNVARLRDGWDAYRLADFLFLREFTYAAMFRFNGKGGFNVPYGGITYNRKSFQSKVNLLYSGPMQARLANTSFACEDFEPFLARIDLAPEDFLFIDPPYDSDFSDYDNMPFGSSDQVRLRDVLEIAPCRVMVVIKDTPAIRRLYGSDHWRIVGSPKTYMWTIKSRNDRDTTHLMITNFPTANRSPLLEGSDDSVQRARTVVPNP